MDDSKRGIIIVYAYSYGLKSCYRNVPHTGFMKFTNLTS